MSNNFTQINESTYLDHFNPENIEERLLKSKNLNIVCCATPNYGHMFPMSRIAIALKERGHTVHVVSMKC